MKRAPPCPRCGSADTTTVRNYGRAVAGRFICNACRRWFGPNNPPDAGGTGVPPRPTRERAACGCCGRVVARRRLVDASRKARVRHRCPHGAWCSAGEPLSAAHANWNRNCAVCMQLGRDRDLLRAEHPQVLRAPADGSLMNDENTAPENKTPEHVANTQAGVDLYQRAWFRIASRMWLKRPATGA